MSPYEKKETILKVENISLNLGGNQILKDVNIEIKDIIRPGYTQGQIVGFLGPSGIGKTKFFEILSGITYPTTGTVLIGEKLEPVKIGQVGVVQQNYPLFNHLSIYDNMEIAAKRKHKNQKERKEIIEDILNRFNILKEKNHWPSQLSGGQKQRAAIAQQILCSNNFLLMDEPFSGLDINAVRAVSDIIIETANMHELNTVIIVSHSIEATASISDTLWVMGRDRDIENHIIPGSKIKYQFDLMERGLAWQKGIESTPGFHQLIDEIRNIFPTL